MLTVTETRVVVATTTAEYAVLEARVLALPLDQHAQCRLEPKLKKVTVAQTTTTTIPPS